MAAGPMELFAQGLASVGSRIDFDFPYLNSHTFLLSSPFTKGTDLIKKLPGKNHYLEHPVAPFHNIFHSPDTSRSISHVQLQKYSLRLANSLSSLDLGPKPGPLSGVNGVVGEGQFTVFVHLPNSLAFPVIIFACLAGKHIITMANPALTTPEIAHIVRESKPSVVFSTEGKEGIDKVRAAYAEAGLPPPKYCYVVNGVDGMEPAKSPKETCWLDLLKDHRELQVAPMSRAEQEKTAAFILWSSGTTGKSKGVVLTQFAVNTGVASLWVGNPIYKAHERWIGLPPFFHVYGLMNELLIAPAIGATVVLIPKFDLERYLRLASLYKATHLHIAPPVAVLLAKSPIVDSKWVDLSTVTGSTSGGAPLGVSVIREVYKRLGVIVKLGFGTSESSSVTTMSGDTWEEVEVGLGSSGKPLFGVEIRIITDDNKIAAIGQPGEIIVRSSNQMVGYINRPDVTAETIDKEGFVHTGDVGIIDKNGNLFIVDRLKEVIKYKGFQVSPAELDAIINGMPSVKDTGVTAVYSDDEGSELPIAYVAPKVAPKNKEEAKAFAFEVKAEIERKCAKYKWLRGGVVVVDEIPKSPTGKILRRLLKDTKGTHIQLYSREAKL